MSRFQQKVTDMAEEEVKDAVLEKIEEWVAYHEKEGRWFRKHWKRPDDFFYTDNGGESYADVSDVFGPCSEFEISSDQTEISFRQGDYLVRLMVQKPVFDKFGQHCDHHTYRPKCWLYRGTMQDMNIVHDTFASPFSLPKEFTDAGLEFSPYAFMDWVESEYPNTLDHVEDTPIPPAKTDWYWYYITYNPEKTIKEMQEHITEWALARVREAKQSDDNRKIDTVDEWIMDGLEKEFWFRTWIKNPSSGEWDFWGSDPSPNPTFGLEIEGPFIQSMDEDHVIYKFRNSDGELSMELVKTLPIKDRFDQYCTYASDPCDIWPGAYWIFHLDTIQARGLSAGFHVSLGIREQAVVEYFRTYMNEFYLWARNNASIEVDWIEDLDESSGTFIQFVTCRPETKISEVKEAVSAWLEAVNQPELALLVTAPDDLEEVS